MDSLGWIVAIFLVLIFGKNINLAFLGRFQQPNAVPTVNDDLPPMSVNQDTNNPPSSQPPPWNSTCRPSVSLPMNPVAVMSSGRSMTNTSPSIIPVVQRVTFTQG